MKTTAVCRQVEIIELSNGKNTLQLNPKLTFLTHRSNNVVEVKGFAEVQLLTDAINQGKLSLNDLWEADDDDLENYAIYETVTEFLINLPEE